MLRHHVQRPHQNAAVLRHHRLTHRLRHPVDVLRRNPSDLSVRRIRLIRLKRAQRPLHRRQHQVIRITDVRHNTENKPAASRYRAASRRYRRASGAQTPLNPPPPLNSGKFEAKTVHSYASAARFERENPRKSRSVIAAGQKHPPRAAGREKKGEAGLCRRRPLDFAATAGYGAAGAVWGCIVIHGPGGGRHHLVPGRGLGSRRSLVDLNLPTSVAVLFHGAILSLSSPRRSNRDSCSISDSRRRR